MNESGQTTIFALLMIPLLMILLTGILIICYALSIEARASLACRTRISKSQTEVAQAASELMKLNPKAIRLETQRQAAKRAVIAANAIPNPAVKAAAIAALLKVEKAQIPIRAQQEFWRTKGRNASALLPLNAQMAIEKSIPNPILRVARKGNFRPMIPKFRMVSKPPGAKTPAFFPAADFIDKQNGGIIWTLNAKAHPEVLQTGQMKTDSSDLIRSILSALPPIDIGCSMTLVPNVGGSWLPQPTEDKLLKNEPTRDKRLSSSFSF